jgi:hypothetical protein
MLAVPPDTPVTSPEEVPTVAMNGLPLLHVPPVGISEKAVAEPAHTWLGLVMGPGSEYTVIVVVSTQLAPMA